MRPVGNHVFVSVMAIAVLIALGLFYAGAARAIEGFGDALNRFHTRRLEGWRFVTALIAMFLGTVGCLLLAAWVLTSIPPPWAEDLAIRDVSPSIWGAGLALIAVGIAIGSMAILTAPEESADDPPPPAWVNGSWLALAVPGVFIPFGVAIAIATKGNPGQFQSGIGMAAGGIALGIYLWRNRSFG